MEESTQVSGKLRKRTRVRSVSGGLKKSATLWDKKMTLLQDLGEGVSVDDVYVDSENGQTWFRINNYNGKLSDLLNLEDEHIRFMYQNGNISGVFKEAEEEFQPEIVIQYSYLYLAFGCILLLLFLLVHFQEKYLSFLG